MAQEFVNSEMAEAWEGESEHWVARADRYDAGIASHQLWMMRAASIGANDRVLDIGCGNGASTLDAARAARSGLAHGADITEPMLELARSRAKEAGLSNVSFQRADAQVATFAHEPFTVVISRFGSMFFSDPVAAFTNIARALEPGGRLAILTWQALHENSWMLAVRDALAVGRQLPTPPVDAPGPFGLASEEHIAHTLTDAGFDDIVITDVREDLWLGADGDDAFDFASTGGMARGLLSGLEPEQAQAALDALHKTLQAHEGPEGVRMPSAAWCTSARKR
jgi:SAM-dependent methyltransferase